MGFGRIQLKLKRLVVSHAYCYLFSMGSYARIPRTKTKHFKYLSYWRICSVDNFRPPESTPRKYLLQNKRLHPQCWSKNLASHGHKIINTPMWRLITVEAFFLFFFSRGLLLPSRTPLGTPLFPFYTWTAEIRIKRRIFPFQTQTLSFFISAISYCLA